jgi:hypothetical protein
MMLPMRHGQVHSSQVEARSRSTGGINVLLLSIY